MPDQILVWTYRNTMGPATKDRYKLNWQAILYYIKPEAPSLNCDSLNELFSVQDINAPDGRQGDRFHEWQKPLELAERIIRHSTKPSDKVIDPFCCTGSFLLAAASLGRIASGCDISKANLAIALKRGCTFEG
jgi:DNA modification methylase